MSFRKIMAVIFGIGVFMTGIGLGVGFVEYSDFSYESIQMLYEDYQTSKTITMAWELEETEEESRQEADIPAEDSEDSEASRKADKKKLYLHTDTDAEVIADEQVAQDEIVFDVNYNSAFGSPNAFFEEDSYYVFLYGSSEKTELEILMDYKDVILEGLKNHKLIELLPYIGYTVQARVNPANLEKIYLR